VGFADAVVFFRPATADEPFSSMVIFGRRR